MEAAPNAAPKSHNGQTVVCPLQALGSYPARPEGARARILAT